MSNAQLKLDEHRLGPLDEGVQRAFLSAGPGVIRVENRARECFASDAPVLTEISDYLLSLGGKRIRPVLAVLSARLFGMNPVSDQLIDAATGIELIHMATLLHDDIIDEAPTRRHKTSAFKKYGLTPTLLSGDFLLVKAFGLCSKLDPYVVQKTERACVELTEGEVLEGTVDVRNPQSLDDYLDIIGKKTASLFALACAVGGFHAGADPEERDTLERFGRYAGIAFQMVDDILDVVAEEDLLGKPSGTDLRQRTPSLVNILWLELDEHGALDFFNREHITIEEARAAAKRLRSHPVINECRSIAKNYAAKANAELRSLKNAKLDSNIRDQLYAIVEYTLHRCL